MPDKKIIFFAKYPQIGKVKTRLASTIGRNKAFAVYNLLLKQNWDILESVKIPKVIEYTPSGTLNMMKTMFPQVNEFSQQKGDNIGTRMAHAFQKLFSAGTDQVILLGSDLADLSKELILTAFEQLELNDVVLGPSSDGGYYLIGFNKGSFKKEIFYGINWSTDQVCFQTLEKIRKYGLSIYTLPERNDIDTFDDIKLFLKENNRNSEFSNTLNFIMLGDR
jgi:uncharacterized protein